VASQDYAFSLKPDEAGKHVTRVAISRIDSIEMGDQVIEPDALIIVIFRSVGGDS
jgi:hypothetical protein